MFCLAINLLFSSEIYKLAVPQQVSINLALVCSSWLYNKFVELCEGEVRHWTRHIYFSIYSRRPPFTLQSYSSE